jgi:DNA-binding NarL/FixJ family response regulator
MNKIRILIADDHAIMRDGIRAMLSMHGDLDIVGEAANGEEAVAKALELQPDIIIMDTSMPGIDGIEATRRIVKKIPQAKVLILAEYSNREYIVSAIKAGAAAYIPKKAVGSELISAVRSVHEAGSFLYPSAAVEIIKEYLRGAEEDPYQRLTAKEKDTLRLLAEGHTSREIADLLHVSLKTVNGHRLEMRKKLDLSSRADLVKCAIRHGLVSMDAEPPFNGANGD